HWPMLNLVLAPRKIVARKNLADRGERIEFAFRNLEGELIQASLSCLPMQGALEQARLKHLHEALLPVRSTLPFALPRGRKVRAEFLDRFRKQSDALILRGHGADDGRMPAVARCDQREHRQKLLLQAVRTFAIRFVQYKDVRDFHQPGLHVLDIVSK